MAVAELAETSAPSYSLLDRDLSWLEFNRRVLHEALDERTPLLERVKFLAIFSSNLDEFFMKRVGLVKRQIGIAAQTRLPGHEAPLQHLNSIRKKLLPMLQQQADVFTNVIKPALTASGIHLLRWEDLDSARKEALNKYFRENVYPVLTPLSVDPGHPFPFISNLSTSLAILLRHPTTDEKLFARLKVPDMFPQWLPIPSVAEDGKSERTPAKYSYVSLHDVISHNLHELFPDMVVLDVLPFRITRNVEVERDDDDEVEDLVAMVSQELKQRRLQMVVRLEHGPNPNPWLLNFLVRKLGLLEAEVYELPAELDFTDLFPISGIDEPALRDKPWTPLVPLNLADDEEDIFSVIRQGDLLVHHPYESFDASVERFIRSAASDPKVVAIKMTVYRVGANTPFVNALIRAAEAGKQVACLVELTARFDEEQNLRWAQALEKVGVHVVYGIVGLKTHTKTTLVVRQDDDGLRCYAHIGTGNYHVKTAKLYTDLSLLTCNPVLTADVVDLFHYLTGRSLRREYRKLLVAPVNMRDRFLAMIEREIEHKKAGRPARIIGKMNQLEDKQIIDALVRASQAGVPINLIVRGFCTLPPGLEGVSISVRIQSVIGRFLEHSRIYFFHNGAEDPLDGEFYIGSADWMSRNLSARVEAVTPIEIRSHRARLWEFLQIMLNDHRQAWDMQSDGSYVQRSPIKGTSDSRTVGTHQMLMDLTTQRAGITPEVNGQG